MITIDDVKNSAEIHTYIDWADTMLGSLGYTEHSFAHVTKVADFARELLLNLGYPKRTADLAWIAGYMHDIGNVVNRNNHAQNGAIMAFRILDHLGAEANEIAAIVSAIGNHDEGTAYPVTEIAAALILGDKTDVRRSRVRCESEEFDIHDRVNYAVVESAVELSEDRSVLALNLQIDDSISPIMEYFEIFLQRMTLCRQAANTLGISFHLNINGQAQL